MRATVALGVWGLLAAAVACSSSDETKSSGAGATGGGGATGGSGGADAATGGAATGATGGGTGADAAADGGCFGAAPTCVGVCASTPPTCEGGLWVCNGPGFEPDETTCDGYDNDCDGIVDEGCPTCAVDLTRVQANLYSKYDIDFDAQCNTYLTTVVSGPDHVAVVPANASDPVLTHTGNANQNMGYALVDPNPASRRVIVTYSCCEACNCLAKNGLTLLYECAASDPGCGCAGQSNCPGFLDAPFLASIPEDTSVTANGFPIVSPTGLAAGAGSTYFVGNWRPETCSTDSSCTACDPQHPGVTCSASKPACCDTTALGRLAQFTAPVGSTEPTFRIVSIFPGEEILTVAAWRNGSVLVGTKTQTGGSLHRYLPSSGSAVMLKAFDAPVYSVTERPGVGEAWVELLSGTPKLHRLSAVAEDLPLPVGIPAAPTGNGRLEFAPDGKLYRLVGAVDAQSTLEVFTP